MIGPRLTLAVFYFSALELFSTNGKQQGRIVGGQKAKVKEFPHQIMIYSEIKNGSYLLCGGSIVSKDFALTAAHCVFKTPDLSKISVYAGYLHRLDLDETAYSRGVSQIILHPQFNRNFDSPSWDFALVKVDEEFDLSEYSKVIDLPPKDYVPDDVTTATGYGSTAYRGNSSDVLKKVDLALRDEALCEKRYGRRFHKSNMLCVGGTKEGGEGVCQGDSGGPLIQNGLLIGVSSFGSKCGLRDTPTVFAKVSAVKDWIDSVIPEIQNVDDEE